MKNREIKALNRAISADRKRKRRFMMAVGLVALMFVAIPTFVTMVSSDVPLHEALAAVGGGSAVMANMAFIGNVADVGDREVAGKQLGYVLYLAHIDSIERNGVPKANRLREVGQINFKPGEKVYSFAAHQILTSDSTGEKGDLTTENTNTVVAIMGGNPIALLNFIEDHAGDKFVIFYGECETGRLYTMGTRCKPMIMKKYERNDNLEKRAITFTFENNSFKQPHIYVGSLPFAEPVMVPADSDTITIDPSEDCYVLQAGTTSATPITAVAGITENDKGRVITLKGEALNNASSIEDGAIFVLEDGATWTAKKNSSISLRIVDASRLVEVNGTRVQS